MGRELLARYAEAHRRYHAIGHLADCLRVFDEHALEARESAVVELALWFHDAVYAVGARDNEARSALLAADGLRMAGLDEQRVHAVSDAILATAHQTAPSSDDARLVCDVDLSILGASPERYRAYADAILAESGMSLEVFRPLRVRFLEAMLGRARIYHTEPFRHGYEMQARQNMMCERDDLLRTTSSSV